METEQRVWKLFSAVDIVPPNMAFGPGSDGIMIGLLRRNYCQRNWPLARRKESYKYGLLTFFSFCILVIIIISNPLRITRLLS
jgi:hypothetical protein